MRFGAGTCDIGKLVSPPGCQWEEKTPIIDASSGLGPQM